MRHKILITAIDLIIRETWSTCVSISLFRSMSLGRGVALGDSNDRLVADSFPL